jgi:hypothetical protein
MSPFRKRRDLDAAISAIREQLHTGYLLTCTPASPGPGFHAIRVTAAREAATVRARPGYYITEP